MSTPFATLTRSTAAKRIADATGIDPADLWYDLTPESGSMFEVGGTLYVPIHGNRVDLFRATPVA